MDASIVTKGLGGALSTALGAALPWALGAGALPGPLTHVLAILGGAVALAFALLMQRYLGILAASALPAENDERAGYNELRAKLEAGGTAARLYAGRLKRFLDWVERFFGDAGMADRTLFPHAFGLKTPAPLWTAPAYDRCLLLALVYPILTIFVIWVTSGHVGPAEAALGLKADLPGWRRLVALSLVCFCGFAHWRYFRTEGWKFRVWGTVAWGLALTFPLVGGFAVVFLVTYALIVVRAFEGCFAVTFAVVTNIVFNGIDGIGIALFFYVAGAETVALTPLNLVAIFVTVVLLLVLIIFVIGTVAGAFSRFSEKANEKGGLTYLLAFFTLVMTAASCVAAYGLASLTSWNTTGPVLLFLGLLTLINAPFDWASLGLTRALLRRGLDLKGWWPLALALIDAASAAVIVALLAIAMVVGVQAFDTLAVLGGGKPILPLHPLFAALRDAKTALEPEYWWIYALLLTTLIPSLINLGIGGASVLQMLPLVRALLLKHMPADKPVRSYDRAWIALALAAQAVGGVILGILTQVVLFWLVIVYAMPLFGLGLLDMAEGVAALELPARFLGMWSAR